MNITVYLGAYEGNDNSIRDAVRELGDWISESGNTLVYGGSKIGLMGVLAESVMKSGGKAIGVEPQFFIDQVVQYDELTELIVTENMSDRKAKMIELGDAFVALPGGTGTLEEIAEIMSGVSLGLIDAPCIIYNHNGYYDDLKAQLARMIERGLSSEERQRGIYFADSIGEVIEILEKTNKNLLENIHVMGNKSNYDWLIESKKRLEEGKASAKILIEAVDEKTGTSLR